MFSTLPDRLSMEEQQDYETRIDEVMIYFLAGLALNFSPQGLLADMQPPVPGEGRPCPVGTLCSTAVAGLLHAGGSGRRGGGGVGGANVKAPDNIKTSS